MKTRQQFGKSLDQFQHLQFKVAEMATSLMASRLLVRNAALGNLLILESNDLFTVIIRLYLL